MASFIGTSSIDNGLVFQYDADNAQKSWKGAPTTNIVTNWDLDTGWTKTYCTNIIFNEIAPPYGVDAPTVGFEDIDASGGGYWYSYDNYASGQTPGSTMTVSLYVKVRGAYCDIRCYTADNAETGRVYGNYISVAEADGWKRCVWTVTIPNPSTSESLSFQFNIPAATRMWLCAPQMETGSFATPFVKGSRSNTQAVTDLTKNNTITASSLTYASDGSFSFNGTSNFAALSTSIDCYAKSYTIEAWIKRNASGVTHGIITDAQFGWFYIAISSANKLYAQHKHYNPVSDTVNSVTGATNIVSGSWYHIAVVFSPSGFRLYVNGVLDASNSDSNAFGLSETSRGPLYIGRAETSAFGTTPNWFNGTISGLKGYSGVALSAAEVKQNFESTRSRFGI